MQEPILIQKPIIFMLDDTVTVSSLRKTVIARSLEVFANKNVSKLTDADYKYYSDTVDITLDGLSDKGIKQAKEIKKDIGNILGKLKKKIFNALKEEIISFATGIPDEMFNVIDISKEVKKTFKPKLDPHRTVNQQYEEHLLGGKK